MEEKSIWPNYKYLDIDKSRKKCINNLNEIIYLNLFNKLVHCTS